MRNELAIDQTRQQQLEEVLDIPPFDANEKVEINEDDVSDEEDGDKNDDEDAEKKE